jgi:hypothetical protein
MIPMMKREGYHADYAVNVTTHAALVGALMPTSHNMIIYSLAAGGKVSIAALILAGVVPALILTLCKPGGGLRGRSQARLPPQASSRVGAWSGGRSSPRCRDCSWW